MRRLLGLAIGVESYAESVPNPVKGAAAQARAIRDWLVTAGARPADVVLRVSPAGKHEVAADRKGIVSGFQTLAQALRTGSPRDGDTVVVYLSGHGYGRPADDESEFKIESGEDVFLTADWSSADPDSNGVRLAQVAACLKQASGPGDHFWFMDACRSMTATGKGVAIDLQVDGRPTPMLHRLFAAAPGAAAPVAGPFTQAVVDGLHGGRTLRRDAAGYWVVFDRLAEFVRERSQQAGLDIASLSEGLPGKIVRIRSVVDVSVTVTVHGAPGGTGMLLLAAADLDPINEPVAAGESVVAVPPDDYRPQLIWDNKVYRPRGLAQHATVDCFADAALEFDVGQPPDARPPQAGGRSIVIRTRGTGRQMGAGRHRPRSIQRVEVSLEHLDSFRVHDQGIPVHLPTDESWPMAAANAVGPFQVDVEDLMYRSELQERVVERANRADDGGMLIGSFIEAGRADPDLEGMLFGDDLSLLAVMAASAVFDTAPYQDLVEPFPSFDELTERSSGLVVVLPTGVDGTIAVDDGDATPLRPFTHLDQRASRAWTMLEPGSHTATIAVGGERTVVRTVALAGRATVLVAASARAATVQQFALSPGRMHPDGTDVKALLRDIQFSAFVQATYAAGQPVDENAIGEEALPQLRRLVVGDWPDPISVCVALWAEVARSGVSALADSLALATGRLEEVAPGALLPDLRTLAALADDQVPTARNVPLLLAAALAQPPLPPDPPGFALDFSAPWVAWKAWPS